MKLLNNLNSGKYESMTHILPTLQKKKTAHKDCLL